MACVAGSTGTADRESPETVLRDLQCPLCLNGYNTPRVLSCLHSFCQACLQTDILKAGADRAVSTTITCPVCKKGTSPPTQSTPPREWAGQIPLDHMILSLLESARGENESTILCVACSKVGKSRPATAFCKDCNKHQCSDCVESHSKFTQTENHKFVGLEDATPAGMATVNLGSVEYCLEHADKRTKFYCEDHKVLCCSSCAIVDHRACSSVLETKKLGRGVKDGKRSRSLQTNLKTLASQLGEATKVLERNFDNMEEQANSIVREVTAIRDKVVQLLDSVVTEVSSKCNQLKMESSAKLSDRISRDKRLVAAMTGSRVLLETVLRNGSEAQSFIVLHTVEDHLHHYDKMVKDARDDVTTFQLYLDMDQVFEELLQATQPLATVKVADSTVDLENQSDFLQTVSVGNSCEVKRLSQLNIGQRQKRQQPCYTGVEYLPDGRLLATDRNNNLCCLLNDACHVTAQVELPSRPSNLAVVGDSEVAVALPDINAIQLVAMDTTLSLSRRIPCTRSPLCVARVSDEELAVGWETGYSVLALGGEEKSYIKTRQNGNGKEVTFGNNDRLAVDADRSHLYRSCASTGSVYCFRLDGQLLFTYTDQLNYPRGIALDRDGNLYVCSSLTHSVHQVSLAGPGHRVIPTCSV